MADQYFNKVVHTVTYLDVPIENSQLGSLENKNDWEEKNFVKITGEEIINENCTAIYWG